MDDFVKLKQFFYKKKKKKNISLAGDSVLQNKTRFFTLSKPSVKPLQTNPFFNGNLTQNLHFP